MTQLIAFITKTFLTEAMLKKVVMVLGDYLVASSKNKLEILSNKSKKLKSNG